MKKYVILLSLSALILGGCQQSAELEECKNSKAELEVKVAELEKNLSESIKALEIMSVKMEELSKK